MRLEKFVNRIDEATELEQLNYFLAETKHYRDEMKGTRLWRATNKNIKGLQKYSARQDRRPKDTPPEVHKWLDDWFKKNFGWRARSEGVFTATTPNGIEMFGKNVNLFYPVNGYKFVYSNMIHDLTDWLEGQGYLESTSTKWIPTIKFKNENYRKDLEKQMKQEYTDNKLRDASWANTEVMMNCPNGYYQIDGDFFRKYYDEIEGDYR